MNIQHSFTFRIRQTVFKFTGFLAMLIGAAAKLVAQTQVRVPPQSIQPEEDYTWWYVMLLVLGLGLAAAVAWMLKTKKAEKEAAAEISKKGKLMQENNSWDGSSLDADKEMEWYRRHRKTVENSARQSAKKNLADNLPKTGKLFTPQAEAEEPEIELSVSEVQEQLQTMQFNQIPVFHLHKLELARPFSPLAISNDEDLMSAIEQAHDEFEEDEEVRDLAVRILARFRTRNSVEALSQVALYDLSSNLRSKAVSVLTDFDHESVFETILICCADPTREVRAAAARGLFRVSFDRADAWTRIGETGDEFRMRQAVLAAKEADLVKRSFDRLIHQDRKIAYEAVTLLALMIKAGETEEIFDAIQIHPDESVKLALVHVLGLARQEETLLKLHEIIGTMTISKDLKDKIDEVIQSFEMIPA